MGPPGGRFSGQEKSTGDLIHNPQADDKSRREPKRQKRNNRDGKQNPDADARVKYHISSDDARNSATCPNQRHIRETVTALCTTAAITPQSR